jgi:transposase-like protein
MTTTNSALPVLPMDTKGRVRTPAADREALLDLFEQGGMTGAGFARMHGIRYSTFAHWRMRRRKRSPGSRAVNGPALFQEVVLDAAAPPRHERKNAPR